MHLPIQSMSSRAPAASGILPQDCGLIKGAQCAASGAALAAGPCNPLGFPESLPVCLPAAASYASNCQDCLSSAAQTVFCSAVSAAESAGLSVPSVLKSLC